MQVILLEKIPNLGDLGDQVNVKAGYARNFLIPQEKAVVANDDNVAAFAERRAELEAKAAEVLATAKARAEKLNDLSVTIEQQASDEGKLFGSVGTQEIARAISAAGIEVAKREVLLPQGVIRLVGEYAIDVKLHSDVTASVNIAVVAAAAA